jgi:hypothetical protein
MRHYVMRAYEEVLVYLTILASDNEAEKSG